MHYTLSDYVLDISQNSIEAGAKNVFIDFFESEKSLFVKVRDDGKGMTEEQQRKALDPFYSDGTKHVKRKVGLGLPFLKQALELTNASLKLESEANKGTTITFTFDLTNVDTPPIGNVNELFFTILTFGNEEHEIVIDRRLVKAGKEGQYVLHRSELIEAVGSLYLADSLILIRQFLASQEEELF